MTPTPLPAPAGVRMGFSFARRMVLRMSIASSTQCRISMACARLLWKTLFEGNAERADAISPFVRG